MLNTRFDFAQLIQPISPEVFFREYWEQRPLHISRGNAGYYAGLLSAKDIDAILQFCKPKYPRVKLGKSNKRGFSLDVLERMDTMSVHDYGVPNAHYLLESGEFCIWPKLNAREYPCTLWMPSQRVP